MEKNYKLTDDQFNLIRTSLEQYYYTCRGDGDLLRFLQPITDLEESLIKQKKDQENEDKEMYGLITSCYKEITGQYPVDYEVRKIGVKIEELYGHSAIEWGWDDTEVRDNVYRWIQEQIVKGLI